MASRMCNVRLAHSLRSDKHFRADARWSKRLSVSLQSPAGCSAWDVGRGIFDLFNGLSLDARRGLFAGVNRICDNVRAVLSETMTYDLAEPRQASAAEQMHHLVTRQIARNRFYRHSVTDELC